MIYGRNADLFLACVCDIYYGRLSYTRRDGRYPIGHGSWWGRFVSPSSEVYTTIC
jgi:hypothetical protein